MKRPPLPSEPTSPGKSVLPTLRREIATYQRWIDLYHRARSQRRLLPGPDDSRHFEYLTLEAIEVERELGPLLAELGPPRRIRAAYLQAARPGGSMGAHVHSRDFAVYYLQATADSGDLVLPELGARLAPESHMLRVIPAGVRHGIGVHRGDRERIAISMELLRPGEARSLEEASG